MSKFLRMIESSLPSEDQTTGAMSAEDVLNSIKAHIKTDLGFFINPIRTAPSNIPVNAPYEGIIKFWNTPDAAPEGGTTDRFKITITPIKAKISIKSEEAEDGAVVSAAAEIVSKDPAQKGLKNQIQAGAAGLARTAIEQMTKTKQRFASDASKKI